MRKPIVSGSAPKEEERQEGERRSAPKCGGGHGTPPSRGAQREPDHGADVGGAREAGQAAKRSHVRI